MRTVVVWVGVCLMGLLGLYACGSSNTAPTNSTTTYSISGVVTATSAGLQDVTMALTGPSSATVTSDASGNFLFANLANGSYTVTPSKSGYTFNPSSGVQTVNNADISSVAFTATANTASTYSISGTVTSSGTGLSGVTMSLSGENSGSVDTDASGNYTFTGLVNGSYTLTPSKAGYTFNPDSSTQTVSSVNVTGMDFTATANTSTTTKVPTIAAGGSHTLALKSDGTVWVSGSNKFGQLGDGTTTDRYFLVQVSGLSGVTAIAAGSAHTVALKSDGTVWAWGYNKYGQLGDGTIKDSNFPVQVSGLTGVTAIAAGSTHTVALKSDGTMWAWGYNYFGQLGNEGTMDSSTPVQVSVADTIAPTAPTNLTATAASKVSQIDLAWSASTDVVGVAGYEVWRGNMMIATTTVENRSYRDKGLATNTSYTYSVRAIDAANNVSAASNEATAITYEPPIPPTSVSELVGNWSDGSKISFTVSADGSLTNFKSTLPNYGDCFGNGASFEATYSNVSINMTDFSISATYHKFRYKTYYDTSIKGTFTSNSTMEGTWSSSIANICSNSGSDTFTATKQ